MPALRYLDLGLAGNGHPHHAVGLRPVRHPVIDEREHRDALGTKTDGVVRMTVPGQPEIEVRLDEGRDNCRLCGIALLENEGGSLRMQRHMRYYRDQKEYADDVGIFLRWAAGSKD